MDSPRERDQPLEQLLRQSLKTPRRAGVTDLCLDAETLAAWMDGSLSGAALDEARLHVADCARCQDLVGTLIRINSDVFVPEPARASRRWLAWAVPLTAAAAAVALWIAVPDRNALVSPPASDRLQVKENDKVAETSAAQPAPPSVDGRQTFSARQTPPAPTAPERNFAPQTSLAPKELAREDAPRQPAVDGRAEKKEVAGNDAAKDSVAAEPSTPAAPAPAAAAAAPSPLAAERAVGRARAGARGGDVAATEILSPDPAVRWRILGSSVEHSTNGGSTWETVTTGIEAELMAGAAPSTTVCWLVGRGGVVLLTTDGRAWRRVAFPETTDLSAVFTVDAGGKVASVTTVDGRTFVTTDGGATWVAR